MKSITRFTRNIRGNKCLNCEKDISEEDNFCSQCGQVNDLQKVSLKQYLSAYFDDFFSFDSRLLITIVSLIFKPGYVTKNYVEGKRMRYMNPFKLYLQITILFFLVVGLFQSIDKFKPVARSSSNVIEELNSDQGKIVLDSIKVQALKELEKNNVKIDSNTLSNIEMGLEGVTINKDSLNVKLKKQKEKNDLQIYTYVDSIVENSELIANIDNNSFSSSEKDSIILDVLRSIDKKAKALTDDDKDVMVNTWSQIDDGWAEISKKGNLKKKAVSHLDSIFIAKEVSYKIPISLVLKSGEDPSRGEIVRIIHKVKAFMDFQKDEPKVDALTAIEKLGFEPTYWNVFLYSKSTDWNEAVEDPENYGADFKDRILSRVSVALFFLLPIFTLIVSLLYIRRKFNYTENLVFVFHVQTVFFLLLLLFFIIGRIVHSEGIVWIFLVIFMIHLYMSMRKFYQQGRIKTLIKYILLNTAFMLLALIGGVIISFIAFML